MADRKFMKCTKCGDLIYPSQQYAMAKENGLNMIRCEVCYRKGV